MIYIDRNSVPKPKFFDSEVVRKMLEKLKAEYSYYEKTAIPFTPDNMVPFPYTSEGLEVLQALTNIFDNKCPFCESLISSNDLLDYRRSVKGRGTSVRGGGKSRGFYSRKVKAEKHPDSSDTQYIKLEERWAEETNDPIMGKFFRLFDTQQLPENSPSKIMYFRPENWATDLYGRESFEHYWWLGFEWKNYYMCCESCIRQKGNRFPVKGDRITRGQSTEDEDALLIDPCRKKDFENEDISFNGPQAIPLTEYGEATIEVLGLNRPALIENRSMVLKLAMEKISKFLLGEEELLYKSKKLFSTGQPYLGAIISNARLNFPKEFDQLLEVMPFQEGMANRTVEFEKIAKTHTKESLKKVSDDFYSNTRAYSLDQMLKKEEKFESIDRMAYFRSSKWIGKVEIENFKNIKKLTLNFPKNTIKNEAGRESLHPWLVLLGENGVGKSSVLQAVAMTLMGQTRLDEFKFEASEYVTRGTPEKSIIKIYLTDRPDPIILTIDKEKNDFSLNVPDPQVILMGYGATRLLTKDKESGFKKDFIRTKNLFDPFKQLDNVQDWLRDPKNVDEALFDAISESLGDLLMLRTDQSSRRFFREEIEGKWQILFEKEKGVKVPLNFLSSGYKAVIALALDIMVGLFQIYGEGDKRTRLQEAEGIALIDEIGVHLHPQWKMWIVGALRRTFPKMNFIVTTHEPLCLRGLEKGEVFVVKQDEETGIKVITDLPSPKDLRIDQLLTSSYFGLNSVLDPEVERKFDRYYELQAMGKKLNPAQKKEFDLLEPQIMHRNIMLGSTMKEEMEYTVIKEKFAHFNKEENKMKPETVEKEIITELKEKWDDALFD